MRVFSNFGTSGTIGSRGSTFTATVITFQAFSFIWRKIITRKTSFTLGDSARTGIARIFAFNTLIVDH